MRGNGGDAVLFWTWRAGTAKLLINFTQPYVKCAQDVGSCVMLKMTQWCKDIKLIISAFDRYNIAPDISLGSDVVSIKSQDSITGFKTHNC